LQTELCTIPKKGIPGLFPEVVMALGAVHQCKRGVFLRDKAHSLAGIAKKIVLKLFEQTTYTFNNDLLDLQKR
jgi:hypothetical protein